METLKLQPATKDYIWGGTKLKKWGKQAASENIAECWELSFNDDGPSMIASGPETGKLLKDVATPKDLGSLPAAFPFFPVLIKLIDAASNLSVQVHPSDDYALSHEGQYGKTEMWYVIEAEPHAGLYIGFKRQTSEEEVRKAIADDTILSLLNFAEVKPGEVYFIPSGTVHAIGGGVTLLEIQQNSTLTYRLYDYHRLGKDGKPRQLHLEKGLKVLNYGPYDPPKFVKPLIGQSPYFSVYEYDVAKKNKLEADATSFLSLTFTSGQGKLAGIAYRKGDTFFVPASQKATIEGTGRYVMTKVEKL
jgi:mannose-6-phosphate isomerase